MKHVLIVEDDVWLGRSFERAITTDKLVVNVVNDASAALDALDELRSDLIILDMFLPNANGLQLLHELKSYDDTSSIPVIICSSETARLTLKSLQMYGVMAILNKSSLTPSLLQQTVKEVLKV